MSSFRLITFTGPAGQGTMGVSFGPYVLVPGAVFHQPDIAVVDVGPVPVPETEEETVHAAWYEGLMDYHTENPNNPHAAGTLPHLAWELGLAAAPEQDEYEATLPAQVEREVEEQPVWEKREEKGLNELVGFVQRAAEEYARGVALQMPSVILSSERARLWELVHRMLSIRSDNETAMMALEPVLEHPDPDAEMVRAHALTLPEGSPERAAWMRAAWRVELGYTVQVREPQGKPETAA